MVFVFVHPRLKWSKRRPLATSWSLDLPCETIAPRIGQAPQTAPLYVYDVGLEVPCVFHKE
jgi:hypothetical protein